MRFRLGILATHPIQYFSPWYRALAHHPEIDLQVFYAHQQTPQGQAEAGFGVPFEWDQPLLEGYSCWFLKNIAKHPSPSHFFGCDTPEIVDRIRSMAFDAFLVSGWHVKSFWQAIQACRCQHIPLLIRGDSQLVTPRSPFVRLAKEILYRRFIPRFDGYLVVGQRAREYLVHYGADASRMFSVPHAVDNDFFDHSARVLRPNREALRKEWGIPPEAAVFLFAGKLLARKHPMDFLEAIRQAAPKARSIVGLVVGDGPLRTELERFVAIHNLPVRFAGFLNQNALPKAYVAADALVLPSDGTETWGLVANEAMASGLPVLVCDQAGCAPDLVRPGETGEIFFLGDVPTLASHFRTLSENRVRLRAMGDAARQRIDQFSIHQAVIGTVEALRQLSYHRSNR
ncbi:MAG: glycosyltransferase family 4 protein [Elusimicrobiota bacterium]|jgi:glycosyltransferase involved in cell wall biosynthesis